MSEYMPHTDEQLDILDDEGLCRGLVADLRETRRLLRAIERVGPLLTYGDNPVCPVCHEAIGHTRRCKLGHYLAACEGKDEGAR